MVVEGLWWGYSWDIIQQSTGKTFTSSWTIKIGLTPMVYADASLSKIWIDEGIFGASHYNVGIVCGIQSYVSNGTKVDAGKGWQSDVAPAVWISNATEVTFFWGFGSAGGRSTVGGCVSVRAWALQ